MRPKSNAEDMEYELWALWRPVPSSASACASARGSSSSRESLRDEEMPSGEEEREDPPTEPGDDDAREASSSESRGATRLPFLLPWYVFGIFSLCVGV